MNAWEYLAALPSPNSPEYAVYAAARDAELRANLKALDEAFPATPTADYADGFAPVRIRPPITYQIKGA